MIIESLKIFKRKDGFAGLRIQMLPGRKCSANSSSASSKAIEWFREISYGSTTDVDRALKVPVGGGKWIAAYERPHKRR